jgi:hypothetical protein
MASDPIARYPSRATFGVAIGLLFAFPAFALTQLFLVGGGYAPRTSATGYSYTWFVLALFVPYAIAIRAVRRDDGPSVGQVLAAAALLSAPLVVAPLIQSQDLFQYLVYARLQVVHHVDPYVVAPNAFARDAWLPYVAWPTQVSVYGPLWSIAMAGIVSASRGSILRAMFLAKSVTLGLEAVTVWGLVELGGGSHDRRAAVAAGAFALNPLVLSSIALSGHADIALAAAFVWAIVADRRRRPELALLLLTAATLVKAYAGLVLVVYIIWTWRRLDHRRALRKLVPAAALTALTFAPYWRGGSPFEGLVSMATRTSASLAGAAARVVTATLVGLDVEHPGGSVLVLVRIIGVAILLVTFVRQVRTSRDGTDPWPAAMALMAAYLLVTPWFLPWHAIGALALVCAIPESSLAVSGRIFSASCLASVGGPGLVRPFATSVARYGPPAISYVQRSRAGTERSRPGIGGRRKRAPVG